MATPYRMPIRMAGMNMRNSLVARQDRTPNKRPRHSNRSGRAAKHSSGFHALLVGTEARKLKRKEVGKG